MTTLTSPSVRVAAPAARHIVTQTYQQFLADETVDPHSEWVDGKVTPMPPISDGHSDLGGWLIMIVRTFVEARKIGVIRYEPFQMKTGPDLPGRSPDLLFVANRHMKRLRRYFLEGPADLAVEIVSPESQTRDRVHKFAEYEAGGVPEYWLVDPDQQTAEFFQRRRNGKYKAVPPDANGIYHSKAVAGFWLRVDWLWQQPLPSTVDVLRAWGII